MDLFRSCLISLEAPRNFSTWDEMTRLKRGRLVNLVVKIAVRKSPDVFVGDQRPLGSKFEPSQLFPYMTWRFL